MAQAQGDAERSLILVKPDAVRRGLIGKVISRFERCGLKISGMKMMQLERELAEAHYGEHRERDFFAGLVDFVTSGPVVAFVVEGPRAVAKGRMLAGDTDACDAKPGSIRGDLAMSKQMNVVHASADQPGVPAQEIARFFSDDELLCYARADEEWVSTAEDAAKA